MGGRTLPTHKHPECVYVGKKMIAFMDDINMPVRDYYGSQPPLELVRLWHDYGYWFDRAKQWRKNVKVCYILKVENASCTKGVGERDS